MKSVEEAVERADVCVEVSGVGVVDSPGAWFKSWDDVGFDVAGEMVGRVVGCGVKASCEFRFSARADVVDVVVH